MAMWVMGMFVWVSHCRRTFCGQLDLQYSFLGLPVSVSRTTMTAFQFSVNITQGDIQSLFDSVHFKVYTPDDQLVTEMHTLFQPVRNLSKMKSARFSVGDLQSGVCYVVEYSFYIGSFHHNMKTCVTTVSSCELVNTLYDK